MEKKLLMSEFILKAHELEKIQLSHMSLFLAIYHQWQVSECVQPIKITRRMLMKDSKIRSIATYHRCMTDLDNFDFIEYQPSYHPKGSIVYWGGAVCHK